ncbi:NAD(P)-binding protein [Micromonospora sp. WMMD1082]|uniref:NAD(P)-binding protein n=1 Tax=Micromonospora sp. WMMD1082 TaxID=3016104 RepID=UPI002415F1CD|nr:NAD(P)-binding protein [Micromonospora sp. WMMD1082]MDG4798116.1 FAD-dependent oxidoreductase [Micromonospora sp. WMMD1082]
MTRNITVIGGGLAGLTAAIACAENGSTVTLHEAHRTLGGRARSTTAPYVANDGPHVLYSDGEPFRWLARRGLVRPFTRPDLRALARARFRHHDRLHGLPPAGLRRMLVRRRLSAPVDRDFAGWAEHRFGAEAASTAAGLAGILTYREAGQLSAAFVWERILRATAPRWPAVRYLTSGWGAMIGRMAEHARTLGVRIEVGSRVDHLPPGPVIVATSLDAARTLLADESLRWDSGHAALLDLGLRSGRDDLFLLSDLDAGGFLERHSAVDPTLAPAGHTIVQAQMPMRAGESLSDAVHRLERLADLGLPGWRDRLVWRREAAARHRTGAVDLPGHTWHDRPTIDRGDGVWLIGDSVAAPGLLAEVSITSALTAARSTAQRHALPLSR